MLVFTILTTCYFACVYQPHFFRHQAHLIGHVTKMVNDDNIDNYKQYKCFILIFAICPFYEFFLIQKRLRYWLRFLKSGQRSSSEEKLKIVILATHLDEFEDATKGNSYFNRNYIYRLCQKKKYIYTVWY